MVLTSTQKKLSTTTLCTVYWSFKSLLGFIYGLISALVQKFSGQCEFSQSKPKNSSTNGAIKFSDDGFGDITTPPPPGQWKRLKEVSEMPGPRSLPFFGTLLTSSALKSSDLMRANEEREQMYGPIVKEEHFWNYPFLMVIGTEEIKKIIKTSPLMRPGMEILSVYRSLRPDRYKSLGLVGSQGDMWRKLHGIFSTVSTNTTFVRSLLPGFNDICSDIMCLLEKETYPTKRFPSMLNEFITESSFYIVFGMRPGVSGKKEHLRLFTNCHDTYWNAFHKSMYGFPWWKYFPTKVWKDFIKAEDELINLIEEITDDLTENHAEGGILAEIRRDQVAKEDLNVVLLELITGATEPVYHAVLITLYWISKNEQVYKRVLEELCEQLPSKDSIVDEAVLDNVPYLKACLTETFRICPTTCNVARILENETEVGGYRLPAYTTVILQYWHACLKDTNFYRAKEYIPERWIMQDGVPPFRPHERQVMANFGIGMRSCPGRKIAPQLIHTFLCKILRKYRVKFPEEIDIRYEWLLVVKEPVVVELIENDF